MERPGVYTTGPFEDDWAQLLQNPSDIGYLMTEVDIRPDLGELCIPFTFVSSERNAGLYLRHNRYGRGVAFCAYFGDEAPVHLLRLVNSRMQALGLIRREVDRTAILAGCQKIYDEYRSWVTAR
jgi:hypothetical protein